MALDGITQIGIEVDKITESIENARTGESFVTEIVRLLPDDSNQIRKSLWTFNWKEELSKEDHEVYKLVTIGNAKIIHGLVSITDGGDHIFLQLIESAKFNQGKTKQYLGVAANLFAFCCKKAFDLGYEGFVSFIAKTKLISHYESSLGAVRLGAQKMVIPQEAAQKLVNKYFKAN